MNRRTASRSARRRPLGAVVAALCLLLAPVCQALCLEPPVDVVHAAASATDCHGAAPSPAVDAGADDGCCDAHAPSHAGTDRLEAPPPALASLRLPALPEAVPAVRAPARRDPAAQGQGPPLRLLTLRFIE
jgi:hypothetical protein